MYEECSLPPSAERAIRRRGRITGLVTALLIYGPLAVPFVLFGGQHERWPDGSWKLVFLLIVVGAPVWGGFWEWHFRRRLRCHRCSGRLKAENRPSRRHHYLLSCSRCEISWDSGCHYFEPRNEG